MRFSLGVPLSASGVQHWLNASWALDFCGSAWTLTDTRTAMASTPRARTLGVRRVVLFSAPALVGPQTGINASLPSTPPTEAHLAASRRPTLHCWLASQANAAEPSRPRQTV